MGYLRYGSAKIRFPKAGFYAIIFTDNPLAAEGYYGGQPKETDNIQSSETEKEGIGVDVPGNRQSLGKAWEDADRKGSGADCRQGI